MRLVDKDNLNVDYVKASTATNTMLRYISEEQVENAPTVEAIPIVWLDMFMQRYKIQGDDEYKLLHFMVTEWKKWEKENE